jgi:hypothetical protein
MPKKAGPIDIQAPCLHFVPFEEAAVPPSGIINHFQNRYWVCHETHGVLFYKVDGFHSPQCNASEAIAISIRDQLYPWAEVRKIPSVFVKVNPRDYA